MKELVVVFLINDIQSSQLLQRFTLNMMISYWGHKLPELYRLYSRQTDRQTDRQIDRQTDRQIDRPKLKQVAVVRSLLLAQTRINFAETATCHNTPCTSYLGREREFPS